MTEQIMRMLAEELVRSAGAEILARIGENNVDLLDDEILEYKKRYEEAETAAEKRELKKDIQFLGSRLMLRSEIKKLKLSKKVQAALRSAIATVLKTQFPFLPL